MLVLVAIVAGGPYINIFVDKSLSSSLSQDIQVFFSCHFYNTAMQIFYISYFKGKFYRENFVVNLGRLYGAHLLVSSFMKSSATSKLI